MLNRFFIILVFGLESISCSTEIKPLCVDKFTLRTIKIEDNNTAMVRGDQQKRLHGAVSIKEHKERIGQYYTLRWNLAKHQMTTSKAIPVKIILRYKQASTGSKIIIASKNFPLGMRQGKWLFKNIGKNYAKKGRILAWRAELIYNGKIVSTQESYLWSR